MTLPCVFLAMYMENGKVEGYKQTAIERILSNLKSHDIPLVIVGDTRYNYFGNDDEPLYSTDGSREIVESYDNTLLFDKGYYHHDTTAQHNKAFQLAAEKGYKWLLWLGCDEYIEGDVPYLIDMAEKVLVRNNPVLNIAFEEHHKGSDIHVFEKLTPFVQRLYAYPGQIETRYTHWSRYYNGRRLVADQGLWLNQIVIHHDSLIRPKERDAKMKPYQLKCAEIEDPRVR